MSIAQFATGYSISDTSWSVFRLPNGYIYIFYSSGSGLYLWKSTDGGGSFVQTTQISTSIVVHGANHGFYVQGALDANGLIHFVSYPAALDTRDIAYATFNTADDSWSAWEQAANLTAIGSYRAVISVDANNKPHIAYCDYLTSMGNSTNHIKYVNKTGASWSSPIQLTVQSGSNSYAFFSILCYPTNTVEVMYMLSSTAYNRISTNNGTSFGAEASLGNTSSILVTALQRGDDGTIYRYTTYGGTVFENNVSTGISPYSTNGWAPQVCGNVRFILYGSGSSAIAAYRKNNGTGWGSPVTVDTNDGNYIYQQFSATGRGSFLTEACAMLFSRPPSSSIDFLFQVPTGVSVSITPAVSRVKMKTLVQPSIPLWVTPTSLKLKTPDPTVAIASALPAGWIGMFQIEVKVLGGSVSIFPTAAQFKMKTAGPSAIPWGTWVSPNPASLALKAYFPLHTMKVGWAQLANYIPPGIDVAPDGIAFKAKTAGPSGVIRGSIVINMASRKSSFKLVTVRPTIMGMYFGILKVWTGSEWLNFPAKVYLGGTWIAKSWKTWDGSDWRDVDA